MPSLAVRQSKTVGSLTTDPYTVSYDSFVLAGSTLAVQLFFNDVVNSVTAITDDRGNTWVLASAVNVGTFRWETWWVASSIADTVDTTTLSVNCASAPGGGGCRVWLYELTGLGASVAIDVTATLDQTVAADPIPLASVAATFQGIAISAVRYDSATAAFSAWGDGFTDVGGSVAGRGGYRTLGGATAVAPTVDNTAAHSGESQTVVFKATVVTGSSELLFIDSVDHYATSDIFRKWTSAVGSPAVVAGGRCTSNALSIGGANNINIGVTNSDPIGCVGFAISPANPMTQLWTLEIRGATNAGIASIVIRNDGSIQAYLGEISAGASFSTLLATSAAGLVAQGIYSYIEFEFAFLPLPGGYVKVYHNGVLVASASGLAMNVFPGQGSIGAPTFSLPWTIANWRPDGLIDDVYVRHSENTDGASIALGDVHIEAIRAVPDATAAGFHNDFTPLIGIDHGAMVDETPPDDDTTYNASGTPGNRDTYRYPTLSNLASGTIFSIQVLLCARKTDDLATRSIAPTLRLGGADFDGTAQAISTSYRYWRQLYDINPSTGVPWTLIEVNALDAGIKDVS